VNENHTVPTPKGPVGSGSPSLGPPLPTQAHAPANRIVPRTRAGLFTLTSEL
jgi:hypothetical protein